jgi:hypothetical protein
MYRVATALKNLFKWEDSEAGDFPVYNNKPVMVPVWGWLVIVLALIVGIFLDINQSHVMDTLMHVLHLPKFLAGIIAILALPTVLIIATLGVSKDFFLGLFRPLLKSKTRHNIKLIATTVGIYLLASIITALIFHALNIPTVADKAFEYGSTPAAILLGVLGVMIQLPAQLFGEELLNIIPFIMLLTLFVSTFKMPRRLSIVIAAVLSCLLFGLYHFQAYDWHLAQMFIIIGLGRLIVLALYIKTKNIWLTFFTHLAIDGTIVLTGLLQLLK